MLALESPVLESRTTSFVRNARLSCPLGKKCQLRMVVEREMFVECRSEKPYNSCAKALSVGGSSYCRALWTYSSAVNR
jgi:hypothetical protein